MMPGAPRQRLAPEIGQRELARQPERLEAIRDHELVIERVAFSRFGAGHELRHESASVEVRDLERALPGDAVDRHWPPHTIGRAPEMNIPAIENAAVERKKDGVAAAHLREIGEVGFFRPVEHIADGAVAQRQVPVHEPRALLGQGEKRGVADAPAREGLALIRDFFHGRTLDYAAASRRA